MKVKNLFLKLSKHNLIMSSLIVLFIAVLDFIFSGNMSQSNIWSNVNSFPIIFSICLFILSSINYSNFNLSVQVGISRNNLWKIKLYVLLFNAFISSLFTFTITIIVYKFKHNMLNSFYINTYFDFFDNNLLNILFMFITTFITLIFILMVFNTWGSFISLFNRLWKFVIYIGIFGSFIAFIISMNQRIIFDFVYKYLFDTYSGTWQCLRYVTGMNAQNTSANNPIHPIITLIILSIILSIMNYGLTKLQQVNR